MLDTILSVAATLLYALSLACIPLVLIRQKEAPNAVAWILTLLFLPLVGVVLFWFLGRNRIRRPVREKGRADEQVRGTIEALATAPLDLPPIPDALVGSQRGVMHLAERLGRRGVLPGNRVDVLASPQEALDAKLAAIEAATDHIHAEYYIIRADEIGERFVAALVRARQRGVRVRVLYDAFGSRGLRRRLLKPLVEAGGYAAEFFPLDPIRRASSVNLRNHRKLLVIDGRVGFTGGINIGADCMAWRDVHLRIRGPAVRQLQTVFLEDWHFATRFNLVHPAFFPTVEPQGDSCVQVVDSGPDQTTEAIHRMYFASIASSQKRVFIMTPYFVPDRAMLVALQTAALRGVDVRLLLPRTSNHRVTFHAGRSFYDDLLRAGVAIYEYLPSLMHAKVMVVDGDFASVGSANLDVRSFKYNFEMNAVIWDPAVVGRLERVFSDDLGHSELVDLDAWRARGVLVRLKEGFGRLCAPLL